MRCIFSRRGSLTLIVLMLALALGTSMPAHISEAQSGGTLAYGSTVAGTLSADAPLILYSFQGHAGDLVRVEMLGLSNGFIPLVDLIAPDRQTLASAQQDGLSFSAQDAHIALALPQDGLYALMLGGVDGTVGDFLLTLEGHAPSTDPPMPYGEPQTVTFSPDATSHTLTFETENCPTVLTLVNGSEGEPFTFPFFAEVRDDRGEEVARWHGGETYENRVTVEPLSGTYEVRVWAEQPQQTGTLSLVVTCADQAPACLADNTGMSGAAASRCPSCPPCGSTTGGELCADFHVHAIPHEDGVVTVTWSDVEGADAAIVSSTDETGALTFAQMVEDATSLHIDYASMGIVGGVQTIRVTVGSEELGYDLCADTVTAEVTLGPVEWGPAESDDEAPEACTIQLTSPRDAIANGLQSFFWTPVEGAESYELHISNDRDTLILSAAVGAASTGVTVNVGEDAIGPGTEFYIRIFALRDGAFWCSDGAIVERH